MIQVYIALAVLAICIYFKWTLSYWRRRHVEAPPPLPIVGNMGEMILQKKHYGEVYNEIYKSYPTAKYVGFYKMGSPAVLVRDLDLVRDVLVANFAHFHDNDFDINTELDPLLASNPFTARGEDWKRIRNQVSPIFTTAKVRASYSLMKEVGDSLLEYLENSPDINIAEGVEIKSVMSKFTTDVVASAVFGVNAYSFVDSNSEFVKMSKEFFTPDFFGVIKSIIAFFAPKIATIFRISLITKSLDGKLRRLIRELMAARESGEQSARKDFIQAFIELKKKDQENKITEEVIVGQALTFISDGTETSATVMSFTLYELARYPEIQKRVQDEIARVTAECGGEMTDEGITKLELLDRCIHECLRLHSVAFNITRICTKPFQLPPQFSTQQQGVTVDPGTSIIVPISAIHMDSAHYDKPHVFDPDRFLDEMKQKRNRYAFLGFGEGPRICLGMRFGLFQVKVAISTILSNYSVQLAAKQKVPPEISVQSFLLAPKDGIWLTLTKKQKP